MTYRVIQWSTGQGEASRRSLEEAKQVLAALLPEGRTYYANTLRNLATQQLYAGEGEPALANALEAVRQHDLQQPVRERERLELGRYEEAEATLRETLADLDRRGEAGMYRTEALTAYSKLLLLQQRWDEAEAQLREIEAIQVAAGGQNHVRALTVRAELALVAIGRERWSEAERILSDVLRLRADAGPIEASITANERTAHAYAACRASAQPDTSQLEALRTAFEAMQRRPPLPRRRLDQAREWLESCAAAIEAARAD